MASWYLTTRKPCVCVTSVRESAYCPACKEDPDEAAAAQVDVQSLSEWQKHHYAKIQNKCKTRDAAKKLARGRRDCIKKIMQNLGLSVKSPADIKIGIAKWESAGCPDTIRKFQNRLKGSGAAGAQGAAESPVVGPGSGGGKGGGREGSSGGKRKHEQARPQATSPKKKYVRPSERDVSTGFHVPAPLHSSSGCDRLSSSSSAASTSSAESRGVRAYASDSSSMSSAAGEDSEAGSGSERVNSQSQGGRERLARPKHDAGPVRHQTPGSCAMPSGRTLEGWNVSKAPARPRETCGAGITAGPAAGPAGESEGGVLARARAEAAARVRALHEPISDEDELDGVEAVDEDEGADAWVPAHKPRCQYGSGCYRWLNAQHVAQASHPVDWFVRHQIDQPRTQRGSKVAAAEARVRAQHEPLSPSASSSCGDVACQACGGGRPAEKGTGLGECRDRKKVTETAGAAGREQSAKATVAPGLPQRAAAGINALKEAVVAGVSACGRACTVKEVQQALDLDRGARKLVGAVLAMLVVDQVGCAAAPPSLCGQGLS